MTPGKFIVIEGIDGAGSSTQAALLVQHLRAAGTLVLATKEPTAGPAGALIRLALDKRLRGPNRSYHGTVDTAGSDDAFDVRALALLFAADRMDHVQAIVEPALAQGRWVVCDRYVLSSLAYQGMALGLDWVAEINRFALTPDLTFYLDVPVEATQARMTASRLTAERYESAGEQHSVREGYRKAIPRYEQQFGAVRHIEAADAAAAVAKRIQRALDL